MELWNLDTAVEKWDRLAAGQWNLDTAQGAVTQWDWHNGRFEVETAQWRQGTSEMQTWRLDNGTLTLHKVQWKNGTVTMEDCTRCMQIFMKTALAQAGATQKCCEFPGKNCRNPAGEQPEPTQNAVNSHKNVAGTHKSPHRSPPQMQ